MHETRSNVMHGQPEQTPGQWAVRWFAVVAVAALCASVPVVHGLWYGVLGASEPLIRTRSQVPAPEPSLANLTDGDWMAKKETELRELSPVVWWLRGNWNELRFRAGVPQSAQVHFGEGEWLFTHSSTHPDWTAFERATPARRKFLGDVRDLVRSAGAELFMVVIPDKARVYEEKAWPGGMPARKAGHYRRVLDELGELGIPTVDLAAAMAEQRRNPNPGVPSGELYYLRDTHWRAPGALTGGLAIAAALEQRYGGRLAPRRVMQPGGEMVVRAVGDLTSLLGLLSAVVPDPVNGQRPVALSLLTDQLTEPRSYYGVTISTPQGPVGMFGDDPDAEVLLIGTSFSEENGRNALSLALGRPVRGIIQRGAQGMLPLRAALDELRRGTKAKVVVWEMVERGMFDGEWLDPKL